ncbi:MAG: hypothetical protein JW749_03360 [Sedimentisphaerales bacterium]|nr:hypothetical protein [Sedimentisphaerales bacterium]
MIKLKFWKGFWTGIVTTLGTIATIIAIIVGCLTIFGGHAKPQILESQNCIIRPYDAGGGAEIRFELLINNSGSKDCSVTTVDLIWPNGLAAELGWESSTLLPKTIPPGVTERIKMRGRDHKSPNGVDEGKLVLQPNQNSIEATVAVKFNTGHNIKKKITLTIGHW